MIQVTKVNSQPIVVNCERIETIEFKPDAIISLSSGEKIVVIETADEIIQKVIDYKRLIGQRRLAIRTRFGEEVERRG